MARALATDEPPRTVEAFDRWHAAQPERWEFIAGVPVLMAPASPRHTVVKSNIGRHLGNKLAGTPCRALVDDAEVKARDLSAIPDIVVTCGRLDWTTATVKEPVLIVEVVSPSSERDDTQRKWQGYCLIPSLTHYLVVAQETRFVTVHTRIGASSFNVRVYEAGLIDLPAIGVSLSLDEIYEDVEFPEPAPDA